MKPRIFPVRLGKRFGDQRDRDHQLGPGAEPGDEAEQAELPGFLRNALQAGENAVDQDAERQGSHPAEIIGDDAEHKPADRPAEQPDGGDQAADRADLRQSRIAAEQFGQGLAQHQPVQGEIGDVERPAGPGDEQHQPLIAGDIADPGALRGGRATLNFRHMTFPLQAAKPRRRSAPPSVGRDGAPLR